jgi:hypothetical protein
MAAKKTKPGKKNQKKPKPPELTTCDGCAFEKFVDMDKKTHPKGLDYRVDCTCGKGAGTIQSYPDIPLWCPLPETMKCSETLLSALGKYLDIKADGLYEVLAWHEENNKKFSEGWMIADQRLYELDEVYEFIDRVTKTNIKSEKEKKHGTKRTKQNLS